MKRVFLILVLILAFAAALPASAQSELRFAVVQVQLWPEYDQPSMLVIYTLQLPEDQSLPVDVSLRIPASVGDPSAVAVFDDTGLVTRPYTRNVEGDWAVISLQADLPVIQIEYYDPALSQSDSPRSYNYQWVGDYGVDEFILSVQQPVGALDFEVSGPDLGDPAIQADGLTYYTANLGIMEAGEPLDLSLSYTKNSTSLSAESFSQQSAPTTTEPGGGSGLPVWVWVLMGVGGAFLLVGVVYFVRASRSAKRPASAYRTKKQRSSSGGSRSTGKQVFCHQCGEPAESGDKFCRECGTKLRV